MDNKSKIFKNNLNKKFHNNQNLFRTDSATINDNYSDKSVRKKIEEILRDNSFIYRILVHIVIDNKIIDRKIIGIYKDNLVTIDNEYIPISKISDIYK